MTKLFRTGGFDPLQPGYEPAPQQDYDGIDDDVLSLLVGMDSSPPARTSRPVVSPTPVFERGKIDFERVRREHPIEDVGARLLEGYKIRNGTSAIAACPVHGDGADHANLLLHIGPDPRTGTFICSSCKAHGDVLDLVKAVMGFTSYREALDFLDGGQRVSQEREDELRRRAEENRRRAAAIPSLNENLLLFAQNAYAHLRKGKDGKSAAPHARQYLASRGLEPAIGRYLLGFTPNGFPVDHLPLSWDFDREAVIPSFGFMNRIIIPYISLDGSVPLVNARPLIDRKPKYLKPSAGGRTAVSRPFRLEQAASEDGVVVITEGEFDAMSLGISAGDLVREVAIPGVNCFRETDAEQLTGRRVILVTDNDAAGRRAQGPLRDLLEAYAERVTTLSTPPAHKDINDLLKAEGRQAVRDWISQALADKKTVRYV